MKTHNNVIIRCQCPGSVVHGHCKHEDAWAILLGKSTKLPKIVEHVEGEVLIMQFGSSSKNENYLVSMELNGEGVINEP